MHPPVNTFYPLLRSPHPSLLCDTPVRECTTVYTLYCWRPFGLFPLGSCCGLCCVYISGTRTMSILVYILWTCSHVALMSVLVSAECILSSSAPKFFLTPRKIKSKLKGWKNLRILDLSFLCSLYWIHYSCWRPLETSVNIKASTLALAQLGVLIFLNRNDNDDY